MYNQGIVVYETTLTKDINYNVKIIVHDFALVYIGDKLIEVLDRTKSAKHSFTIDK